MADEREMSALLDALQSGIPLTPKPFEEIARALGLGEQDVLDQTRSCMENGHLIRVGPVLDTRAMGFHSSLYAVAAHADALEAVARSASARPEVTHCYQREDAWALWFTATVSSEEELGQIAQSASSQPGVTAVQDMRTVRRFKLNARFSLSRATFGTETSTQEVITPSRPEGQDALLLSYISEGLSIVTRPYRHVGDRMGLSEDDVITHLKAFLRKGWVRRYAGVVSHIAMGFRANALLVREMADDRISEIIETLRRREDVSHLYQRRVHPGGPEVLCAMVHARTAPDMAKLLAGIPCPEKNKVYRTVRCFKRSFFRVRV